MDTLKKLQRLSRAAQRQDGECQIAHTGVGQAYVHGSHRVRVLLLLDTPPCEVRPEWLLEFAPSYYDPRTLDGEIKRVFQSLLARRRIKK